MNVVLNFMPLFTLYADKELYLSRNMLSLAARAQK